MNKIIKQTGEYLSNKFTGENGTWELVATESNNSKAIDCIDEFKNIKTGQRLTTSREKVLLMAEAGTIFL
ncbi:hypothetical protein [Pedobacter antarcticus]|uniref:hypothetical protein n=1 Tax=Pedobacter antarcticus TaxID=34086 RepID=UPI002931E18E|nr:hypothetical protein [Pedobacter antarcticus]